MAPTSRGGGPRGPELADIGETGVLAPLDDVCGREG